MSREDKYDLEKLRFRSQFVLGPHFPEELVSWKRINLRNGLCLSAHPDLNTDQVTCKNVSITLLGYLLDPYSPYATDSVLINRLLAQTISTSAALDTSLDYTYALGGRWILIIDDGKEPHLFHDPGGLRQLFYTDTRYTGDLWCASQPGLIAKMLGLQMSEDALDFIESFEFRTDKEYRWPGASSPYKEVRHLLPNHYLSLESGKCQRYWPTKGLDELPLREAVGKITDLLQGLVKSAANRFELALGLTAGWDSRLILAASKDVRKTICCTTVRQLRMRDDDPDIQVASRLASKVGLRHHVLKPTINLNNKFLEIYKQNVLMAHDVWAPDAQAILDHFRHSKAAITGSMSEVAKCYFRSPQVNQDALQPWDLSAFVKMGKHPFALKHFDQWLSGLGNVYNINPLDVFVLEQGSNWLAMCQLEFDIAWKEIFTPYNCRALLVEMLSVDEQYRKPPEYTLYKKLVWASWPELLCEPVNPHRTHYTSPKWKSISSIIKKALRKTHLSQYVPEVLREFWRNR